MTDTQITDFEDVAPFPESPRTECKHESDGLIYTSDPPQYKCIHCGVFFRLGMTGAHTIPPKIYTQADLDAAVQKEREACARLADAAIESDPELCLYIAFRAANDCAKDIAEYIRARGQKEQA